VRLRGDHAAIAAVATEAGPEDQSQLPLQAENGGPQ
jgi:hypothetical protein